MADTVRVLLALLGVVSESSSDTESLADKDLDLKEGCVPRALVIVLAHDTSCHIQLVAAYALLSRRQTLSVSGCCCSQTL